LTRAVALRNNRCGAIRLNLKGREPFGRVCPGAEQQSLIDELREDLLALRNPAGGEPIVTAVTTSVEAFGPKHHPDVPDLMVVFRGDLGLLESCVSPRVGLVHVPVFHPDMPRSGEHTPSSCLWVSGRGIKPAQPLQKANVLDVAPTVLLAMNVPVPHGLSGSPILISE
jgi:predicted AlkP superfamily phosphohydrolase/phosphomutase